MVSIIFSNENGLSHLINFLLSGPPLQLSVQKKKVFHMFLCSPSVYSPHVLNVLSDLGSSFSFSIPMSNWWLLLLF
jgi:hypothetical protein